MTIVDTLRDEIERIIPEDFGEQLRADMAAYGMSVVTSRALPDARDGLKPVQRRILYGMWERGYRSDRPTTKSGKVVGEIMGSWHPHGDTAIYDAAARMVQSFTMRYPLLLGKGNFGNANGSPPAAERYTEMKLQPLGEALLRDIDKDTVPMRDSYLQDGQTGEPLYLPGRIPPVCNPVSGIAWSMATMIPPHNLAETLRACIALLDKPTMRVDELIKHLKGPDFPTGGIVVGLDGIRDYLKTGRGRIVLRGEVALEDTPRQRALVVSSLPYVSRNVAISSIIDAINDRKVEGLVPEPPRDESSLETGTRIVLPLKKEADPAAVVNQLYKHTRLQVALAVNMNFIFGAPGEAARTPRVVGMLELLNHWNEHQMNVLTRRTRHELGKAEQRLHLVDGMILAAERADEIVQAIRNAKSDPEAVAALHKKFKLSQRQAAHVIDLRLRQVKKIDGARYRQERTELLARIKRFQALLKDPALMREALKDEMRGLIKEFGDERRTYIDAEGAAQVQEVRSLFEDKPLAVALSTDGYLRAAALEARRTRRNGGGRRSTPKDADVAFQTVVASMGSSLLLLTSRGRVYALPARDVPETDGRGESLRRLVALKPDEAVRAMLAADDFLDDRYLVTFSRDGKVKKTSLDLYRGVDTAGVSDMALLGDDELVAACVSNGACHYLVAASDGRVLRFDDADLRAVGRGAQGVQAMSLARRTGQATVAGAACVSAREGRDGKRWLLLVLEKAPARKIRLTLGMLPLKARATAGLQTVQLRVGDRVVGAAIVDGGSEPARSAAGRGARSATRSG